MSSTRGMSPVPAKAGAIKLWSGGTEKDSQVTAPNKAMAYPSLAHTNVDAKLQRYAGAKGTGVVMDVN